jgi:hypothetical protein
MPQHEVAEAERLHDGAEEKNDGLVGQCSMGWFIGSLSPHGHAAV